MQREDQQFAIFADAGDVIADGFNAKRRFLAGLHIEDLLAGALLGGQLVGCHHEAATSGAGAILVGNNGTVNNYGIITAAAGTVSSMRS